MSKVNRSVISHMVSKLRVEEATKAVASPSISGLIWSKAEILRIQASVFKNSATFSLPPLSTGWPSQSSSTSKS